MSLSQAEITVNKLAEYMVARSARQRTLLKERKYPNPDFNIGMYHREASEAVSLYIANGAIDSAPLQQKLQILEQMPADKVGTGRRINANIDAIERVSEMLDDIDLQGADPRLGEHAPPKLTYHNVTVSVRPEIILRGTAPKGAKLIGAIKLHFSSTHPHDEESAGYVSAVVQEYCKTHLAEPDEIVNPDYCMVICAGSGQVFPGVKATARRMKDVAAACQNIAGLWPAL
ncbi:hypothetical protein [Tardibacter chloracetimidivorans]|uniref:hypothetical protein n=1 Tax=Tardibacter chloracetimidivorans TaxID=1921510 RepID=UPI0009F93C1A|nr:hypothetical protein [Tardibacter chloracetimidivorans]